MSFSFASAANLLGLAVQDMDEEKSQIAHGETVRETANMISFLTETTFSVKSSFSSFFLAGALGFFSVFSAQPYPALRSGPPSLLPGNHRLSSK